MMRAVPQRQVSRSGSIPAPVGGWNARDSIGDMPTTDAVVLTNWRPATTEVVLRDGYTKWATGLPSTVETLLSFAGVSTAKLFAVSNGSIYDVTAGGAVGAAAVSGLTNSRFQYVNMETAGGNWLMAVNGADKMRYFDGTTWTAMGDGFTITVADTSNWIDMTLHKQRLWGIKKNSLIAYYLPTGSIQGAASVFDLTAFFQLGGSLVGISTWTIDGGQGVDDFLVFVSSRGEVLIYGGTDPAGAWAMRGLYRMGSPIGNRCLYKFGGDLLVICQDGLFPLSKAIQSDRIDQNQAVSAKIQSAMSQAIASYGTNFGWHVLNYPKADALILNVPVTTTGLQQQYVMNTLTGAWCNFTGWGASCWALFQDNPYFGGSNYVGLAFNGTNDNGNNIQADALQAFDYFGSPGNRKRFTMLRPIFRASGPPSAQASVNVDFDIDTPPVSITFSPSTSAAWDVSTWDAGKWGGLNIYKNWQGANTSGYSGAPRITVSSKGMDVRWVSTDLVYERGGVL
jgi:hypothetical protein